MALRQHHDRQTGGTRQLTAWISARGGTTASARGVTHKVSASFSNHDGRDQNGATAEIHLQLDSNQQPSV